MTSKLQTVSIDSIDANPWRNLSKYPFVESKVNALVRSIKEVGLWEGIIVRKVESRYQLAFGHHRWRAAKKASLRTIPVIVRDLTDREMVQFMGRENLEDWNADFRCMYESWEAAISMLARERALEPKTIVIARELGWVRDERKNETAQACASARELIQAGHLTLDDLDGKSVFKVRELCQHTVNRMKQVEKIGRSKGMTTTQIERDKKHVVAGMKSAISGIDKKKKNARSNIRAAVDTGTWSAARKAKKRTPLFAQFGKNVAQPPPAPNRFPHLNAHVGRSSRTKVRPARLLGRAMNNRRASPGAVAPRNTNRSGHERTSIFARSTSQA